MIASDIMTRNVLTIHPDASAQEAARLLSQERISGAPVVDANGKVDAACIRHSNGVNG